MRLASETPQTDLEQFIEDVLFDNGYNREEIQFRDEDRYLRIGYWERLESKALLQLGDVITAEEDIYEDDCGWLYFYKIKKS